MLKHACVVAVGAFAVAVLATAPTQPAAAASCKGGYEPVRIQGNWVCRLRTPKPPLKANQNPSRSKDYPKHLNVESWSFGGK
jgi:hypothetical protein